MTIYVDKLQEYHSGWWCHMWHSEVNTPAAKEELHAFAANIGLKREWAQNSYALGEWPHYDLRPSIRKKAIAAGAIEKSLIEFARDTVNDWIAARPE